MWAWIYAVREQGKRDWVWRYSLDLQADRYYWSGERPGAELREVGRPMSLGQAVWLTDKLSAGGDGEEPLEMLRRMCGELARESWPVGDWLLALHSTGDGEMISQQRGAWTPPDEPALRRFELLLQGRALLRPELEQSLAAAGWEHGLWPAVLQLLALRGRASYAGGLEPPGRGYGRRRRLHGWRCRRCGCGARLHASPCPFCGTDCPYCEACLALGRARFCAVLALGAPGQHRTGTARRAPQPLYPRPPAERLARWRLSEPQAAAAQAALAYLRAAPQPAPAGLLARWAARLRPVGAQLLRRAVQAVPATLLLTGWASRATSRPPWIAGRAEQAVPAALPLGSSASQFLSRLSSAPLTLLHRLRPSTAPNGRHEPRQFLLWAVTGAGKTEMIFPLLEDTLLRGGRAAVASPRRDVILELDPRLRRAFPQLPIATLYGGSTQRWEQTPLTLATTHQLMRFEQAFDLLVLDELDAYPYHNNPMLQYAATKTIAPGGVLILLSATPPRDLRRLADRGRLPHARVPVRYHRHPLPEPLRIRMQPLKRTARLPRPLLRRIRHSIDRGAQTFVFVPQIALVARVVEHLRREFPHIRIEGTSSRDPDRTAVVTQFRERSIRLLVTTTILERGVTVPKSDVYILEADSPLFDEAALVQMAGRAGRSADDPAGIVIFAATAYTRSQRSAIRQIRSMNRLARRRRYLEI